MCAEGASAKGAVRGAAVGGAPWPGGGGLLSLDHTPSATSYAKLKKRLRSSSGNLLICSMVNQYFSFSSGSAAHTCGGGREAGKRRRSGPRGRPPYWATRFGEGDRACLESSGGPSPPAERADRLPVTILPTPHRDVRGRVARTSP